MEGTTSSAPKIRAATHSRMNKVTASAQATQSLDTDHAQRAPEGGAGRARGPPAPPAAGHSVALSTTLGIALAHNIGTKYACIVFCKLLHVACG